MAFRKALQQVQAQFKAFQDSETTFRVLATVKHAAVSYNEAPDASTRTLFILDSSFNPPSIAHQALAERALHAATKDGYEQPHRLLLLLSTLNADKAPSPAPFAERLTMMTLFAQDLLEKLKSSAEHDSLSIDVGITTAPYYTDKSQAIEKRGLYAAEPKHVHLLGFDTLTRVFAAKYYSAFDPPFSALDPYFDAGHELRATLRPDDNNDVAQQKAFLRQLEDGSWLQQGGKPGWAKQVYLVPPNPRTGVSSTKIRNAAKQNDWSTVQELCSEQVAQCVQAEHFY